MSVRAVIFDFGGVLVRTKDWSKHRHWETQLGLQEGELPKTLFVSETSVRATIGQATVAEVWQSIATTFNLDAEQACRLERDFFGNDLLNEELATFFSRLRPRYKTAILSNAWPNARDIFGRRYSIADLADTLIISAEEGLAKPDTRIFLLAAERLGVHLSEAIFVDDWLPNVHGANDAGMHGILFQTTAQVIADVQAYLDD